MPQRKINSHNNNYYGNFSFAFLAPTPVLRELCKRSSEYTKPIDIRVGVATYNVNGGKHFRSVVYKDLSLTDWLLDSHKMARSRCKLRLHNFHYNYRNIGLDNLECEFQL